LTLLLLKATVAETNDVREEVGLVYTVSHFIYLVQGDQMISPLLYSVIRSSDLNFSTKVIAKINCTSNAILYETYFTVLYLHEIILGLK
jgi:hypothetical protein